MTAAWLGLASAGCDDGPAPVPVPDAGIDAARPWCETVPWAGSALPLPAISDPPDERAVRGVLYELQVRSANACDPQLGSAAQREACLAKPAPRVTYRAQGTSCGELGSLERIRLGTLDDLLVDTDDYREAISLRYIDERVGADLLWFMPLFPNNDIVAIPAPCDNLGSPYAVRDYFHVAGTLSADCIALDRDEYSDEPCWGDDALDAVIAEADRRGLTVMLDVAFNHFGHGYLSYDIAGYELPQPLDEATLWDFDATYDPALLWPEVLDSPAQLDALTTESPEHAALLGSLRARCPDLQGQALVRAWHAWRLAFAEERATFVCGDDRLEARVPSFFLGGDARKPSTGPGDGFTRDWFDVRFLFHRMDDAQYRRHALRTREYVFRALNYWMSRGVGGFRLDHATDDYSGIRGEHWRYLQAKLTYYASLRGQAPPLLLAEEFHHQDELAGVADIMTEGYLFDMTARNGATKDAPWVERALGRADRFGLRTLAMAALENHDELRLLEGTGFNAWTGAGFWALGAASATTPMLLVGQEFAQPTRLGFKRSHFLSARFEGGDGYSESADALIAWYAARIGLRRSPEGSALRGPGRRFLRTPEGAVPDGVVAMLRWSPQGDVALALHNLWEQDRSVRLTIPTSLAPAVFGDDPCARYRFVDLLDESEVISCREAAAYTRGFGVFLGWDVRHRWARPERCAQ